MSNEKPVKPEESEYEVLLVCTIGAGGRGKLIHYFVHKNMTFLDPCWFHSSRLLFHENDLQLAQI